MLLNLDGELTKIGYRNTPRAISYALGCKERAALNKFNGSTPLTLSEARIIKEKYFSNRDDMSIDWLFEDKPEERDFA